MFGFIADIFFEIDGQVVDDIQTATKIGTVLDGTLAAFFSKGVILEPFSLLPGTYSVDVTALLDLNRDGLPPFFPLRFGDAEFEVIAD